MAGRYKEGPPRGARGVIRYHDKALRYEAITLIKLIFSWVVSDRLSVDIYTKMGRAANGDIS